MTVTGVPHAAPAPQKVAECSDDLQITSYCITLCFVTTGNENDDDDCSVGLFGLDIVRLRFCICSFSSFISNGRPTTDAVRVLHLAE